MPQMQLPIIPQGATPVTADLSFERRGDEVSYFYGSLKTFTHHANDRSSLLMITAQFCVNGQARQADVAKAMGLPQITLKRAVKKLREDGPAGFYRQRAVRGAAVLIPEVLAKAQAHLDGGASPKDVAQRLEIKPNTLDKALRGGRLRRPPPPLIAEVLPSKSQRSGEDAMAPMGVGADNVPARLAASLGGLGEVMPQFESALDIPCGGVLCALPALLASGLLQSSSEYLTLKRGYYGLDSVLMLLAFMALCRMKSIEDLRHEAPGEWGLLLGLDRVPEVRTMREKVRYLSEHGDASGWSMALCSFWIHGAPEDAMVFYVDGHVRVYHGDQTPLPKHYAAREKLCLRATVDYWVNAMDGQPFLVINKVVDQGLIQAIETDILPRLEQTLSAAPERGDRLTLVFDREGYSPDFFKRMKDRRIACLTYNKFPGERWPLDEFSSVQATLCGGEEVTMLLAERGTQLSNGMWVREIRKLEDSGHQTAILSTDFTTRSLTLAPRMFARWSQENFFRYMRAEFGIDRLASYQTEEITDPTTVVNPTYRQLEGKIRQSTGKLSRALAHFGSLNLEGSLAPPQVELFLAMKADQHLQIEQLQAQIAQLKAERKATPRRVLVKDLPEPDRFRRLSYASKHFLDTLKMIAYRAETAMANILREWLPKADEVRTVLSTLYQTDADLLTDLDANTLTVRLHHSARVHADNVIRRLLDELNETVTIFPRTNLRLIYKLGSTQNP